LTSNAKLSLASRQQVNVVLATEIGQREVVSTSSVLC